MYVNSIFIGSNLIYRRNVDCQPPFLSYGMWILVSILSRHVGQPSGAAR